MDIDQFACLSLDCSIRLLACWNGRFFVCWDAGMLAYLVGCVGISLRRCFSGSLLPKMDPSFGWLLTGGAYIFLLRLRWRYECSSFRRWPVAETVSFT